MNRLSPDPFYIGCWVVELVVEPVTAGEADTAKDKQGGSLVPFPSSLSPLQHPAGNTDLQEKNPGISLSFGKNEIAVVVLSKALPSI